MNRTLAPKPMQDQMPPDHLPPPAIALRAITKRFGPVLANDAVDFAAHPAEVHALVGENGAGKSTLMSILAGLYRPDAGTLLLDGQPVAFRSPADAIARGIGMVYQHFMLIDSLTVAENVLLGLSRRGWRLDTSRVERELSDLADRFGLQVDPRAPVWTLSVGEQQRVEILRLLHRGARVLVFDEPTAVLTPGEANSLLQTMRGLAAAGFAVVFISHKLDEVLAVADRITVLRRGRTVATTTPVATDRRTLARLMVGRDLAAFVEHPDEEPRAAVPPGAPVLELRDLTVLGDTGRPAIAALSLRVRAAETLGIAGVAGNGQRELAEAITGLRPTAGGEIFIADRDATDHGPATLADLGVAHIPEDRLATGLIPSLDLAANAVLRTYDRPPLCRGPFLRPRPIADFADRLIADYDVAAPSRSATLGTLSGGNQQKLLLGRELAGEPRLIVAVHPTRGVDVGATEAIHRLLHEQRARGAATLLISEDLDELLALADRISVLYEGKIMGTVMAAGADRDHLGLLMAGGYRPPTPPPTTESTPDPETAVDPEAAADG
jgi:ABC-type uncharacterized transport system ATPase subunit